MSAHLGRWLIRNRWIGSVLLIASWLGTFAQALGGSGPLDFFDMVITMDHLAFYTAGRIVLDPGLPAGTIYDNAFVSEYQAGLFPGRWNALEAFRNPPFYALLYTTTAWMPYRCSAFIWGGISLLALVLGIRWLAPERPRVALWHAINFYPVLAVMQFGQNSLLSFAIVCGTYRLLANRRPFAAGMVAGLLAFKPTLLIGLIIWCLIDLRRKWPCALGALLTISVLSAVSFVWIPTAWEQFLATLPANSRFDVFEWWKNHTPRAFVRLLFPGTVHTKWEGYATIFGALVGVAWFLRIRQTHGRDLRAMFAAAVLLTLWASPHALIYEWAIAFAAGYLFWERAADRRAWEIPLGWMWLALLVSTEFCRLQIWIWKQLDPERSPAVWEAHPDGRVVILLQVSLPAAFAFGWMALRLLRAEAAFDTTIARPPSTV